MSKKRSLLQFEVERGDTGDSEGRGSNCGRCGVLTVGFGDRKRQVKTPILFSELPNNLTADLIDHILHGTKSRDDEEGKEKGLGGFGLCVGYGRAITIQREKDNDSLKNKVNAAAALGVPCSSGIVLLSQRSPLDTPLGSSGQQYSVLPLSGGRGKCKVTSEEFMSVAATLQPDIVLALSDEISGDDIGKKRRDRATSRSKAWLDVCRQQAESSDLVLYADVTHRATETKTDIIQEEEGIQGYVIYMSGLGKKTPTPEYISTILPRIVQRLPTNLPRCIYGVSHPIEVLECVAAGFDIFCSGWVQALTKDGKAFCSPINPDNSDPSYTVPSPKRPRTEFKLPSSERSSTTTSKPILKLLDDCYARDSKPLVPGCECFACIDYSRAYIHHLLKCGELLGSVLLELHNTFRYRQFFEVVRGFTNENRLAELKKWAATAYADL